MRRSTCVYLNMVKSRMENSDLQSLLKQYSFLASYFWRHILCMLPHLGQINVPLYLAFTIKSSIFFSVGWRVRNSLYDRVGTLVIIFEDNYGNAMELVGGGFIWDAIITPFLLYDVDYYANVNIMIGIGQIVNANFCSYNLFRGFFILEKWRYDMNISWKSGVCVLSLPWKNGERSRQIMK